MDIFSLCAHLDVSDIICAEQIFLRFLLIKLLRGTSKAIKIKCKGDQMYLYPDQTELRNGNDPPVCI